LGVAKSLGNTYLISTNKASVLDDRITVVTSLYNCLHYCDENNFDFLIMNSKAIDDKAMSMLNKKFNFKLIPWAHNTPNAAWCNKIITCPSFYKLVYVSNIQRYGNAYLPIYNKSITIFNFLDENFINSLPLTRKVNNNLIIYIGALVPAKGFQHIAASWKKVHENCPNLHLEVCGSPKVYSNNMKMGREGIAEEQFELEILSHLGGTRATAKKMGIDFLGAVPKQQIYEKINECSFVLVNPNLKGSLETFCVSAIEGMALNKPIIAAYAGGLIEVVGNNIGGLLFTKSNELSKNIIKLYGEEELRNKLATGGRNRFLDNFEKKQAIERWTLFLKGEKIAMNCEKRVTLKRVGFYLKSLIRIVLPIKMIMYIKNSYK
jgi:glycosyltransferase involved in cell wall biosynthesis